MFLSFNLQYLRYERRRVVRFGVFLYLSCITHAQLSKGANRIECKLAVLSDLVSGYGENFFSAGVFFIGIDILRGVKMWESEGFVNVRSISRFCECDLLRKILFV